jgi:hypothetical protein
MMGESKKIAELESRIKLLEIIINKKFGKYIFCTACDGTNIDPRDGQECLKCDGRLIEFDGYNNETN